MLYADGTELTTLGDQNRTVVPRDKISKVVKDAVVSAEDTKFYDHTGIDMKGIARAAGTTSPAGTPRRVDDHPAVRAGRREAPGDELQPEDP